MLSGADQELFLIFQATTTPGVPTCYYDTIPNYAASSIQYLATGITMDLSLLEAPQPARAMKLSLSEPLGAGQPQSAATTTADPILSAKINSLRVTVVYHTEYMLQVKVIHSDSGCQYGVFNFQLYMGARNCKIISSSSSFYKCRNQGPRKYG